MNRAKLCYGISFAKTANFAKTTNFEWPICFCISLGGFSRIDTRG
jgi:hypothetical protein